MPPPSRLAEVYQTTLPAIEAVKSYVSQTLIPWCDRYQYLYTGRIKDLESLAEKIETGRFPSWSSMDDLYACTIVVPTADHEDGVLKFLEEVFDVVELKKKNSTRKPPEVFRFDSTRFVGRIRSQVGLELTPGADAVSFEVQIPSAFDYAWQVVTHDLVYKSEDIDWRKARLVAQLKAAVEQIELIIAGFQANVPFVAESAYPELEAKQRIIAAFKQLIVDGTVSQGLTPHRWSRFAENVYDLVRSYSRSYASTSQNVDDLIAAVSAHLRESGSARELMSGSLQQVIVGCISSGVVGNPATLENFVIVDSSELRDFQGVQVIPKAFDFNIEPPPESAIPA
jgi:ppGpp synthetase/RelA/SpoT-type nucleotidyltranferase